jgi:hypothetical protein
MRRIAILAATLALAYAGCGGDSDESAVEEIAREFGVAILNGEGHEACTLMTDAVSRAFATDLEHTFRSLTGERTPITCPEAVGLSNAFARGFGPNAGEPENAARADRLDEAVDASVAELDDGGGVEAVMVDGDRATAQFAAGSLDGGIELRRNGSSWLVAELE